MKFVKVSGYENVNDEIFVVLSGVTLFTLVPALLTMKLVLLSNA